MMPRERRLAIIIGSVMGVLALYQLVNMIAITPYRESNKKIENARKEISKYETFLKQAPAIRRSWDDLAARTYSYETDEIRNRFEQEIKRLVVKHQLRKASYTPRTGSSISRKPPIKTEAYLFAGEGDYDQVMNFIRDAYYSRCMTQITTLSLTPMDPKSGRNQIKVDLQIETPLLPTLASVDKKEKIELASLGFKSDPKTFIDLENPPTGPVRRGLIDDQEFAELLGRNVFRMYVPAPTNMVKFENNDRLDVTVTLKSFWDGKPSEQLEKRLPGKSNNETQSITGDVVEVTATYADGKPAQTRRFDEKIKQPWVFAIASHTPPEQVILAIENKDEHPVDVTLVVTGADGKAVTKPTIRVKGKGKEELDAYVAKTVVANVMYESGKPGRPETFTPKEGRQMLVIGVEPKEPEIVKGPEGPKIEPEEPIHDADANKRVTGRWMYGEHHEMFAIDSSTNQRVIYAKGDVVDVDGVLVAAHPEGGIVYIKKSDSFYLYPIGRMFPERINLGPVADEHLSELDRLIDEALSQPLAAKDN